MSISETSGVHAPPYLFGSRAMAARLDSYFPRTSLSQPSSTHTHARTHTQTIGTHFCFTSHTHPFWMVDDLGRHLIRLVRSGTRNMSNDDRDRLASRHTRASMKADGWGMDRWGSPEPRVWSQAPAQLQPGLNPKGAWRSEKRAQHHQRKTLPTKPKATSTPTTTLVELAQVYLHQTSSP